MAGVRSEARKQQLDGGQRAVNGGEAKDLPLVSRSEARQKLPTNGLVESPGGHLISKVLAAHSEKTPQLVNKIRSQLEEQGINYQSVQRIIYPAAFTDGLTIAAFLEVFPSITEVILIDMYLTVPAVKEVEKMIRDQLNNYPGLKIEVVKVDYLKLPAIAPMPDQGRTLLIDKYPGRDSSLRANPEYRESLLRDSRAGDIVFSIIDRHTAPLSWESAPLIASTEIPFLYGGYKGSITELVKSDFKNKKIANELEARSEMRVVPEEAIVAKREDGVYVVNMKKLADQPELFKELAKKTDQVSVGENLSSLWLGAEGWQDQVAKDDSQILFAFDSEHQLIGVVSTNDAVQAKDKTAVIRRFITIKKGPKNDGVFLLDALFSVLQKKDYVFVKWMATRSSVVFYQNYLEGYRDKEGTEIPARIGNQVIESADYFGEEFSVRLVSSKRSETRENLATQVAVADVAEGIVAQPLMLSMSRIQFQIWMVRHFPSMIKAKMDTAREKGLRMAGLSRDFKEGLILSPAMVEQEGMDELLDRLLPEQKIAVLSESKLVIPAKLQNRARIFNNVAEASAWLKKDKITAWMTTDDDSDWARLIQDVPSENREIWTSKRLSALYSALGLKALADKLLAVRSVLSAA